MIKALKNGRSEGRPDYLIIEGWNDYAGHANHYFQLFGHIHYLPFLHDPPLEAEP
jgi:hypothetical protein